MNDVASIISQLEQQKSAIERALEALREVSNSSVGKAAGKPGGKTRRLSPEGRRRIAEAARRRWALARKAAAQKGGKPGPKKAA